MPLNLQVDAPKPASRWERSSEPEDVRAPCCSARQATYATPHRAGETGRAERVVLREDLRFPGLSTDPRNESTSRRWTSSARSRAARAVELRARDRFHAQTGGAAVRQVRAKLQRAHWLCTCRPTSRVGRSQRRSSRDGSPLVPPGSSARDQRTVRAHPSPSFLAAAAGEERRLEDSGGGKGLRSLRVIEIS